MNGREGAGTPPEPAAEHRRGGLRRCVRIAAITLAIVWIGPVTLIQTDAFELARLLGSPRPAVADPRLIPTGEALVLAPGTGLTLHLKDGTEVRGSFLGRTMLEGAPYTSRFGIRDSLAASHPALGETLHVVLRNGREWHAAFAGYGELALLLKAVEGSGYVRVPFETARRIIRANGDTLQPKALAAAFRAQTLSSAEALAIDDGQRIATSYEDRWNNALRVPMEDVAYAVIDVPPAPGGSSDTGSALVGGIVIGVVVGVVLFVVLLSQAARSEPQCGSTTTVPNILGVHVTRKAFDRYRGCYVGDDLAASEPWPAEPVAGGSAAKAAPLP